MPAAVACMQQYQLQESSPQARMCIDSTSCSCAACSTQQALHKKPHSCVWRCARCISCCVDGDRGGTSGSGRCLEVRQRQATHVQRLKDGIWAAQPKQTGQ